MLDCMDILIYFLLLILRNWAETRDNLLPEQNPADRPDIVARVFRLKVLKLLEMLKCEMIFGKVQAWLYSIKWQKRGLPHCH